MKKILFFSLTILTASFTHTFIGWPKTGSIPQHFIQFKSIDNEERLEEVKTAFEFLEKRAATLKKHILDKNSVLVEHQKSLNEGLESFTQTSATEPSKSSNVQVMQIWAKILFIVKTIEEKSKELAETLKYKTDLEKLINGFKGNSNDTSGEE